MVCVDPMTEVQDRRYVKVPKGHVWLQGDNHRHSTDSRKYGPLPMGLIKGKVVWRLYPDTEKVQNGLKMAQEELLIKSA